MAQWADKEAAYSGCMTVPTTSLESMGPTLSETDSPLRSRVRTRKLIAEKRVLLWLQRAAARLGRVKSERRHLATGKRGELEALFYLRQQGYQMTERRWRSRGLNGDIDLIGWDGDRLAIVEVKARTKRDFFAAEATIDDAKRKMLFRMARAYTRTLPDWDKGPAPVRFDVVAVYLLENQVECTLTRDAFRPER